jgi:hypothetical protein
MELVQDFGLICFRYADTRIGNGHLECPIGRRHPHGHLALVGELDGIANEIQQNLSNSPVVAEPCGQVWRDDCVQGQILLRRQRAHIRHDPIDDILHRIAVEQNLQFARLDLGKIQYVIDLVQQVAAVAVDTPDDFADFLGHFAVDTVLDQFDIA